MKTIAIIAQKGGSGKTTTAVHLGVAAAKSGLLTAIIDLDPQATARSWGGKRTAEEGPEVIGDHASRLPHLLDEARKNGAELVIVDSAPNADQAALAAARAADLILIPCRPSVFDLEAIRTTLDLAQIAKKPAFVLLNAVPVRSRIGAEAAAGLREQGAQVAPVSLSHRAAFGHSVIDGRSAQEYEPAGKAAEEVAALFSWICGQVGISSRGHVHMKA